MSIRDNGFTLVKSLGALDMKIGEHPKYLHLTGSLSELRDWLSDALIEVAEKIDEIG